MLKINFFTEKLSTHYGGFVRCSLPPLSPPIQITWRFLLMASGILGEGIWLFELCFLLVFSFPLAAHLLTMWGWIAVLGICKCFILESTD